MQTLMDIWKEYCVFERLFVLLVLKSNTSISTPTCIIIRSENVCIKCLHTHLYVHLKWGHFYVAVHSMWGHFYVAMHSMWGHLRSEKCLNYTVWARIWSIPPHVPATLTLQLPAAIHKARAWILSSLCNNVLTVIASSFLLSSLWMTKQTHCVK